MEVWKKANLRTKTCLEGVSSTPHIVQIVGVGTPAIHYLCGIRSMNKKIIFHLLFALFILQSCSSQKKTEKAMGYQDDKFEAGQNWKYLTRSGEENSTLTILKVEQAKGEIIVHVALKGLKVKNPHSAEGLSETIDHLPLSKEAVVESVTELLSSENQLPEFMEGYKHWKEAFETGRGGVFSITIKEAVEYVEQTMKQ